MAHTLRFELTPRLIAPVLRMTGFRFDKTWRHAESGPKAFVYRYIVSTVRANILADGGGR